MSWMTNGQSVRKFLVSSLMTLICISTFILSGAFLPASVNASKLAQHNLKGTPPPYRSPLKVKSETNTASCPALPANFDFANATDSDISHYHLSPRPRNNPRELAHWIDVHRKIKYIHCISTVNPQAAVTPSIATCQPSTGEKCYLNWSGYGAGSGSGAGFGQVSGDWNVEKVDSTHSPSSSRYSTWVGLGGIFSRDNLRDNLWQAGTAWNSTDGYYVWYQAVGGPNSTGGEVWLGSVNWGDHIYTNVWLAGDTASGQPNFEIVDGVADFLGNAPNAMGSGMQSAEWINERPACGRDPNTLQLKFYQLADFSYTEWTHAVATPNNSTWKPQPIGTYGGTKFKMENNDGSAQQLTNPGGLGSETGSGTDNFQDHWLANGSGQCG